MAKTKKRKKKTRKTGRIHRPDRRQTKERAFRYHFEAYREAIRHVKQDLGVDFAAGQMGYFITRFWQIYTALFLADPASVDEVAEVHGIVAAILEAGLPEPL